MLLLQQATKVARAAQQVAATCYWRLQHLLQQPQ